MKMYTNKPFFKRMTKSNESSSFKEKETES